MPKKGRQSAKKKKKKNKKTHTQIVKADWYDNLFNKNHGLPTIQASKSVFYSAQFSNDIFICKYRLLTKIRTVSTWFCRSRRLYCSGETRTLYASRQSHMTRLTNESVSFPIEVRRHVVKNTFRSFVRTEWWGDLKLI